MEKNKNIKNIKNDQATQSCEINEINELENKIQELTLGWQRTQADFENYRKRVEGLKSEWIKSANTDLILKLLPLMDNFRRANMHLPENLKNDNWALGVTQIEKQFENILSQEGAQRIETKAGDIFDHNIHEAVTAQESDKFKTDQIIQVLEDGYMFGDKVLRPVKVVVAK